MTSRLAIILSILSIILTAGAGTSAAGDAEPLLVDATRPTCRLVTRTATSIHVQVQDAQSGLKAVNIRDAVNAAVTVDPFTEGTTDPVSIRAERLDFILPARFFPEAVDVAGIKGYCTNWGYITFPDDVLPGSPTGG